MYFWCFYLTLFPIYCFSQFKIIDRDSLENKLIKNFQIKSITETQYEYKKGKMIDSAIVNEYKEYDTRGNLVKLLRSNNWSPFLHGPLDEDSVLYAYDSLNRKINGIHYFRYRTNYYKYYYENNQRISEVETDSNGMMIDSSFIKYNLSGYIIDEITYKENIETYRSEYFYDINNRLTKKLWIILASNDTIDKNMYQYNDGQRELADISYNYKNDTLTIYLTKYDKNGNKIYHMWKSLWDKFDPVYKYEYKYYYDEHGNLVKKVDYINSELNWKWYFKYENNLLKTEVVYLKKNIPFSLSVYTYKYYQSIK
jgi:hypothetical protein